MPRKYRDRSMSLAQLGITRQELNRIAFASGFCSRTSGKLRPCDLLIHMCAESVKGTVSYNDLAARIETATGIRLSRQACWERFDESCVLLFQQVLAFVIDAKCRSATPRTATLLPSVAFSRILLQDSTVIQLPAPLFAAFSGVRNATHTVCNARIQCVYDLKAGTFLKFTIDPYSKNDLSVTLELDIQPGDLVLRDRGYFTVESVRQHRQAQAHCIFRYKHKTALFDAQTGAPLDLLALLKHHRTLDLQVRMGSAEQLPVRLIAAPVDEETANLRKMRARKEMKGHAPSRELLDLMGWSIFITTIDNPAIGFEQILALYGLRWRIENIFKTWKSHFHFDTLHRVSESQLRILLTARFIMMTHLYHSAFLPLACLVRATSSRTLSLIKFMRYIIRNLSRLPELLNCSSPQKTCFPPVLRYCTYDQRHRQNFISKADRVLTLADQLLPLA
jgi:hypothetical protein